MNRLRKQTRGLWLCGAAALATLPMIANARANGDTTALRAAALDTLANMVLVDKGTSEAVRNEAVTLLGQYGGPAHTAVLVERLESAPSSAAAVTAVRALGEAGDETVLPVFRRLFTAPEAHETAADLRWSVADAAGEALLKCGDAGLDVVLEASRGSDAEVRRRAIQTLAKAGGFATPTFFAPFADDADRWVRYETARILGALGDTTAVPSLKELLDDAEANVRLEAAKSLARLGDPAGITLLRRETRLNSKDGVALRLLARLDPAEYLAALIGSLDRRVPDEELDDVAALLSLCERATVGPPLIEACRNEKTLVRANAAGLLGRLKESDATEALAALLQDASWDVRARAAEALGSIGKESGLPALLMLGKQLERRRHDAHAKATREACAVALARLGKQEEAARLCLVEIGKTKRIDASPEVVAHVGGEALERVLIESVRHPDPGRPVAHLLDELEALERLGSKAAAPALEALLRERPYAEMHAINLPEVWAGLLDSLGTCGGPAAATTAAAYAKDGRPIVRLAACRGILRLTTEDPTRD